MSSQAPTAIGLKKITPSAWHEKKAGIVCEVFSRP
jgi:hypothetical protein